MTALPAMEELVNIVKTAAHTALLPAFKQSRIIIKDDGSYVTQADLDCQLQIKQALSRRYPDIAFIAEEMHADEIQHVLDTAPLIWCLDPLDGTSNFAAGMPYYAISLALIKRREVISGIVYDPNRDECFTATRGHGAFLNQRLLSPMPSELPLSQSVALVDLKRLSPELRQKLVLHPPYHSQRSLGAVALDWCWLAARRVQIYCHGSMRLWDYAAGLLIATEAGCVHQGLDHQPVQQFNLQARQACAAVDADLFSHWQHFLDE